MLSKDKLIMAFKPNKAQILVNYFYASYRQN